MNNDRVIINADGIIVPQCTLYKFPKIIFDGQSHSRKGIEFDTNSLFSDGKIVTIDVDTGKPIRMFIEDGEKVTFATGSFEDIVNILELPTSEITIDGKSCMVLSESGHDVKVCKEGTPISSEKAWKTILERIAQIQ